MADLHYDADWNWIDEWSFQHNIHNSVIDMNMVYLSKVILMIGYILVVWRLVGGEGDSFLNRRRLGHYCVRLLYPCR